MFSSFRFPLRLLLLLVVLATAFYVFLPSSQPKAATAAQGPQYDCIFGVHSFDPDFQSTVALACYVFEGTLYLEAKKLPVHEGTISTWVTLYRYNSATGVAEPLPMPSARELQHIEGRQQFVLSATRHLALNTQDTSPDGYALAEPNWVPVNPVRNVLGNIALFLFSGGFETIKAREETPRLAKPGKSVAMQSDRPIFRGEGDDAFLLAWVVPNGTGQAALGH